MNLIPRLCECMYRLYVYMTCNCVFYMDMWHILSNHCPYFCLQTINPDVYRGPWGGANCRDSVAQTQRNCNCASGERGREDYVL